MAEQSSEVNEFLEHLEHPLKAEVKHLRLAILASNAQLSEHIKWNAPSFGLDGNDRVTFNLHAKDHIKLIFHRGAKPRELDDFAFDDETGWLQWAAPDRGVLRIESMADLKTKEVRLIDLINRWIKATS